MGKCIGGFSAVSVGVDGGVKVRVDGTGECGGGKGPSCGGVVVGGGGEGVSVCCCRSGVAVMRVVRGGEGWGSRGSALVVVWEGAFCRCWPAAVPRLL